MQVLNRTLLNIFHCFRQKPAELSKPQNNGSCRQLTRQTHPEAELFAQLTTPE